MGIKSILVLFTTFYFICFPFDAASAQTIFVDPNIPDGETVTYTTKVGDKSFSVVEKVSIITEGDRKLYEIISLSDFIDRKLVLDKETMAIVMVHTLRKYPEVTLDSKLKVKDEKPVLEDDSIRLADFAVMTYVFRGFPFTKRDNLKIGFYGAEQRGKFTFKANYKNKEVITVNNIPIECHKLEFGLDGFWGTFLPKMNVWYSVEPPHFLVQYKGLVGPPGSPKRDMQLSKYAISGAGLKHPFDNL
jgi:hypothetical protein